MLIPEDYVPDLNVRLALYRRLSDAEQAEDREALAAELIDRFGPLPPEADQLLKVVAIKGLCREANVAKIDVGPEGRGGQLPRRPLRQPGRPGRLHPEERRRSGACGPTRRWWSRASGRRPAQRLARRRADPRASSPTWPKVPPPDRRSTAGPRPRRRPRLRRQPSGWSSKPDPASACAQAFAAR